MDARTVRASLLEIYYVLLSDTILKANDEVSLIMAEYKKTVEGITENGQADNNRRGMYCLTLLMERKVEKS